MYLKSISNINFKATPFFSELINNYKYWKPIVGENVPDVVKDDELLITTVQEVYGYRTGILGYFFHHLHNLYSPKTYALKSVLNNHIQVLKNNNLSATDFELFTGYFSYINRFLPLINFGTWDYKEYLKTPVLKYLNKNESIQGLFDFCSPFLDSGCGILSNKEPIKSGFERLTYYEDETQERSLVDNISRKGIVWCLYKGKSKNILVMSFNLSDYTCMTIKLLELEQILTLQNNLESELKEPCLETYIIGDFKVNFDMHSDFMKNVIEMRKFNFINNDSTHYLFHKHDEEYLMKTDIPLSQVFTVDITKIKEDEVPEVIIIENSKDEEEVKVDINFNSEIKIENYFSRLSPSSMSSNDEWTKI